MSASSSCYRKIIILIRLTNFKFSAPAAADDDDDEEEVVDRAMLGTSSKQAYTSMFFFK